MIHNIPKPDISPDFTIADIRKIREWNYERLKDATVEERLADTRHRAAVARKNMDAVRNIMNLVLPKGKKPDLQAHAAERGESLNGFVNRAIDETVDRDKGKDGEE